MGFQWETTSLIQTIMVIKLQNTFDVILLSDSNPVSRSIISAQSIESGETRKIERAIIVLEGEGAGQSFVGFDFYEAMCFWRQYLEHKGLRPALQGALKCVFPSRLQREMGDGSAAHCLDVGQTASAKTIVNIFDSVLRTSYVDIASVDEQRQYRLNFFQQIRR
jgi:hypothetical protein